MRLLAVVSMHLLTVL